jgi:hypothetical protein
MNQAVLNRSRNDKFTMVLDLPKAMKNIYDPVLGENLKINPLQFSIYGSPVPAVSVPDINVGFGGQVYRVSSNSRPAYNPLTIRFLVDSGYKNYWILWNWLNLFNDAKTSTSDITHALNVPIVGDKPIVIQNPITNYTSQFSIFSLDEFNKKIVEFKYTNAFPTNLAEINFSNQDPSEINCSVTFAFNQLQVELIKDVDKISC